MKCRYSVISLIVIILHGILQAKEGDNLLDVVINNDIDIDGFGACEGTLACSTCHLIFTQDDFNKIDEEATDEELDMLVRTNPHEDRAAIL